MLVKVLKQMGLHGLLLVRCLVVNVSGEKCWHLAVQQQLPLHLELLLQQLLLCCLLVPELKHLVVGFVFLFISIRMKTVINSKATDTMTILTCRWNSWSC